MSIQEYLPSAARRGQEVDGRKGLELVKVARRDRRHFDCGIWLHEASEVPKEQFKREAEKELTGKVTEPSEIIYFKLHKSQIPRRQASDGDDSHDAGHGKIVRLLPGNELRHSGE
jgi:hypothetical protein